MNNINDAKKMVIDNFTDMKILSAVELDKCFVINIAPKRYTEKDGLYVGGGVRVDKKTEKIGTYNPMIEKQL